MDMNDLRSIVTVVSLLLFIGLVAWTWRPRAKRDHEAAARLPFDGEALEAERSTRGRHE
ncbi:MAG TPA: cbb3-type cytochrome c oxidase subunit 3 [Burkholderiaceae bacterium]|jgi:cytochrome c oxidase cbb3-type subunit 4|nr:cbb3-type cytochrome c oxidase subunit 3 [Burkholderiaceae bacterium]